MRRHGLKGQGATEYLLLVAVIIVIGIIVATIVAFAGTGGIPDARKIRADAYWRSMRPLGIIDSTLNPDGTLSFILRNNEADPLNVKGFRLDDGDTTGLSLELGPGETATITVPRPSGDCEFDVSIDYAVGELDLQENGNMGYIVNCQSGGGQPEQAGGGDCIGAGQASSGDCCSGLIYSNGYCRQESGVCTNNNQCLSANCGPDNLCSSQPEGTCDPRCSSVNGQVCEGTLNGCVEPCAAQPTTSCSAGQYTLCAGVCAIPCNADGGTCTSDSDCCGSNCGDVMANVCGEPAGQCYQLNEACNPANPLNGGCCSQFVCNPDGAGAYQCGDTGILLDNDQQCVIDSDCSSGICQFDSFQFGYNVCSACRNEEGSCTQTSQCCPSSSGGASCEGGTCVGCGIGDGSCIPGVPPGEPGSCCPGYLCSYYNHACIPDTQCLGEGDVCQGAQAGTCCSGYCDPNSGVCAAAPPQCLGNGISCAQSSECCSDYCDPGTGTCACAPIGNECSTNSQCCTSICDKDIVPNMCACIPDNQACGGVPVNCCSGSCNGLSGLCEAVGKK